jgi:thioredoxin reductase (NADPH)
MPRPSGGDDAGFFVTGPDVLADGGPGTWWKLEREPLFLESSSPGISFAGDVRHGSIKRVASAVGEGPMAVQQVHRFLAEQKGRAWPEFGAMYISTARIVSSDPV